MSEYNFPIGAKVIRPGMPICIYLGNSLCQHPQRGRWPMCTDSWVLVQPDTQPEPTTSKEDTTVSKFKVGDKVKAVNVAGTSLLNLGEIFTVVSGDGGYLHVRNAAKGDIDGMRGWRFELVQPEPAHESDWSYAEAERLQKLAHEAIDAYNEYINAKPNTVFLTIIK